MGKKNEKSQEEMVKEAVKEAKKAKKAADAKKAESGDQPEVEDLSAELSEEESEDEELEEEIEEEEASEEESEEEDADDTDSEADDHTSGKKLFGRKEKKKDKKDEKIDELTDKLTRQMAEFDNFRKRTEREKSQMYEIGARDVIEKILPTVDNLERGLDAVNEEDKDSPFVQGMEMIYKQLMSTLDGIGVKPIEAVGTEFNPDFHNAVMHVDDEEVGENIVVEELQKGYMYRDTVVRHSMVKVAN